jgi:hypothetical protein
MTYFSASYVIAWLMNLEYANNVKQSFAMNALESTKIATI